MKKTALFAALLGMMCFAQEAKAQMSVELYDKVGSTPVATESLKDLQSIRIGGPSLVYVHRVDNVGTMYELSGIRKLAILPTVATAIKPVSENLQLNRKGDEIIISGWDSKKTTGIAIYSVNGVCQQRTSGWNGKSVDITSLKPGVYVLRIDGRSYKFKK